MVQNRTGLVIRAYRNAQQLSCADLARLLGVAESTLRSYENGHRRVTPEHALEWERLTHRGLTRQALLPEFFAEAAIENTGAAA